MPIYSPTTLARRALAGALRGCSVDSAGYAPESKRAQPEHCLACSSACARVREFSRTVLIFSPVLCVPFSLVFVVKAVCRTIPKLAVTTLLASSLHVTVGAHPAGAADEVLAAGEFALPAAGAFGDPGFHEGLTAAHRVPPDSGPSAGRRLVLSLRDAGRADVGCASEHPLSGCATVDWSDFEGRPGVPDGGVFDNSITLQLASGEHRFFLSETLVLAEAPDSYKPT